jgi:hypothetical protein
MFSHVRRALRLAWLAESDKQRYQDMVERASERKPTRRSVITGLGGLLAASHARAARSSTTLNAGVVGAGLAGLACSWELHRRGVPVTL